MSTLIPHQDVLVPTFKENFDFMLKFSTSRLSRPASKHDAQHLNGVGGIL